MIGGSRFPVTKLVLTAVQRNWSSKQFWYSKQFKGTHILASQGLYTCTHRLNNKTDGRKTAFNGFEY
jgi:hypothetical protein